MRTGGHGKGRAATNLPVITPSSKGSLSWHRLLGACATPSAPPGYAPPVPARWGGLEEARRVQQHLFPRELPRLAGWFVNGEGRCVAAHVRRASDSGTAYKAAYSCVPLTDAEHRLQHQKGESALKPPEW